jgi:hypothetical protein
MNDLELLHRQSSPGFDPERLSREELERIPLRYWVDQVCTHPGVHHHEPPGPPPLD